MELSEYQTMAARTAVYRDRVPKDYHLTYVGLGLAGEGGEAANKIKKVLRDEKGHISAERRAAILDEAGDALWYVAMICDELGESMEKLALDNLMKLKHRYGRPVPVPGSATSRDPEGDYSDASSDKPYSR